MHNHNKNWLDFSKDNFVLGNDIFLGEQVTCFLYPKEVNYISYLGPTQQNWSYTFISNLFQEIKGKSLPYWHLIFQQT